MNSNHYKCPQPVDGFTSNTYVPSQRRSIAPPTLTAVAAPADSTPVAKKSNKKVTFDGLASPDRPLAVGQIVVNPKGLLMSVMAIRVDGPRAWVSQHSH